MLLRTVALMWLVDAVLCSSQHWPGVVFQVNERAMTYVKDVGMRIINHKVAGFHIPDINGRHVQVDDERSLHWSLTDIYIREFNAPPVQAMIQLQPPHALRLHVGSMVAKITAKYKVKIDKGWFHISKHGSATARGHGAATLDIGVTTAHGKPQLGANHCVAGLDHLDLHFDGNLGDQILNFFSKIIAGVIKVKVNAVICTEMENLLLQSANPLLASIPTSVELADGFEIDYSLVGNPRVTHESVSVGALARFWFRGHHNDSGIPAPAQMPLIANSQRMLCVSVEADAVIGSAGYAAQVSGLLHDTLTQAQLAQVPLLRHFMQCSCDSGLCIGTLIPQISSVCGAGDLVEIDMDLAQPPVVNASAAGLSIGFGATADFRARLAAPANGSDPRPQLFMLNVSATAVMASDLHIDNWAIKGHMRLGESSLRVVSSAVGAVDQASLNALWRLGLVAGIQFKLNQLIASGIPLPPIGFLNVTEPQLYFATRTIVTCANFVYTGPIH